jgi:3-oxoacyl-[acyl-carrier-protein] synthase-3
MGTCIESVATSVNHGRSALHAIDDAATSCLGRAKCSPARLDLLINAGLYKDANAAEPALATIIQEDIGANPEPGLFTTHGTFSFDILNGGCGVLTAARILETFVGAGTAHHGMVVAGDVDPSPRTSAQFPFSPAAGAMLVGPARGDVGFRAFESVTFPDDAHLFEVTLHWDPHAGFLHRGRNILDVHEEPTFAKRATERAAEVASAFLEHQGLHPTDIDLLITSQYPRALATDLGHRLGISWMRVPRVRPALACTHTAGPIAALEAAFESGQFARAQRTLFVTVGAGLAVDVALYVAG